MASDDGFREIQLSGKQLVFLFMATTIVAVVIFLCGVMVGRGVKSPGQPTASAESAPAPPVPDAQPLSDNTTAARGDQAGSAGASGAQAAGVQPADATGGAKSLDESSKQPAPVEEPPAVSDEPATQATANTAPAKTPTASAEPATDGWAVQVAAFADEAQARAIFTRLASKGYAVYLVTPPPGGGMYRVRVGKFKDRREAENVMRRLQKEEQFTPWITR